MQSWAQLGSELLDKHCMFFMKDVQLKYLEYEHGRDNNLSWVVSHIMPQMKQLKKKSTGLGTPLNNFQYLRLIRTVSNTII